jgi:hypothetical protein
MFNSMVRMIPFALEFEQHDLNIGVLASDIHYHGWEIS